MTGRDLVTASLRLIGAVAPGESLEAAEATDGLSALNRMIQSWSNDSLMIHAVTAETALTLTPSDGTYTLGASGNITTRPIKIERALIRDAGTDYPLTELSAQEFTEISQKSITGRPQYFYDDGAYPQRVITLYPIPSAADSLVLYTKRPLTEIATLNTDISLPPGYEEALIYNLAIRLAPEYGRATPQEVVLIAQESRAGLERVNQSKNAGVLRCDDALTATGSFNINTGEYS
jgi:hypothetical protein